MSEYYIGQTFEGMYPPEAAEWCNENNAYIEETTTGDVRTFMIKAIVPHVPTHDEISEMRKQYRREHIDDKTAERSRKMANGTWTDEDEQEYLDLDSEVTEYIEENYPYPEEN